MEASSGKKFRVSIELPQSLFVDASRVAQLVSNLLGNALTHGDPEKPICLSSKIEKGDLVISVSNGGEPIPTEISERLFQPFFRGSSTNGQGLGLGLHIASEIAKAHGGTLSVVSSRELTTFEFRMPDALRKAEN